MGFEFVVRDAPILNGQFRIEELLAIALLDMSLVDKVGLLKTKALTIPVDKCAAEAGSRQETFPPANGQCGLIRSIAKGDGLFYVVLHHRLSDREPQLVVNPRRLEVREGEAGRATFDSDHFESRPCQLQRHHRAGQADADCHYIDRL